MTTHSGLEVVALEPVKKRTRYHVFRSDTRFDRAWWEPERWITSRDRWLSIRREGLEIARVKCQMLDDVAGGPVLDILALEVVAKLRGQGIGRATIQAIRQSYPGPRLTALNDNAASRGFWASIGWVEEPSRFPLPGIDRVTYTEP